MGSDPWGVAVVPAEGDPGGLVFGHTRLPIEPTDVVGMTRQGRAPEVLVAVDGILRSALPLRWERALVTDGWDRLRRALASLPEGRRPTGPLWAWLHDFRPLSGDLLVAADFAVRAGLAARAVVLDLVDGRLVEVPRGE